MDDAPPQLDPPEGGASTAADAGAAGAAADTPPSLQALFRASGQRQNLCVLAVLTWLASCDGSIAAGELELLRGVAAGVAGGEALPAVVDVARLGRPEDLELACRHLRGSLDRGERALLARLLVTMAAQDGYLTVAENHVLRFLADLLGLSARRFAKLFEEVTHRPFPEAGDPGDPQWWRRREAGEQAGAPSDAGASSGDAGAGVGTDSGGASTDPGDGAGDDAPMTRRKALDLFGLAEGASADAVHSAYRRLAKARHPDRFARLGAAAQATAAVAFGRVHRAYEVLSSAPAPSSPAGGAPR